MRVLIVMSGHPWLYRSAQWEYVRQIVEENKSDYFHVVLPKKGVVPAGFSCDNCSVMRSRTDSGYFLYRDVGNFASVNEGKNVVDVVVTFTAEMAMALDLHLNQRGFTENGFNLPIVVWHHMFHAVKDKKWREATAMYPSLYCSEDEFREWTKFLRSIYKPSHVAKVLERSRWFTFSGKDLNTLMGERPEKYEKTTFVFGARFNSWHKPEVAVEIFESVYAMGVECDFVVTTPDASIPRNLEERLLGIGAKLHLQCGMKKFHEIVGRCHAGLITGKAGGPVYISEFLAAGTLLVTDRPHTIYKEVRDLEPRYPFIFDNAKQAVSQLVWIARNREAAQKKMDDAGWGKQLAESIDYRRFARESVDWMRTLVPALRRKESGKGMPGTRARIVTQLASVGGCATLSEMVEITKVSGTNVHDEQVGRWVTRKLIHDILVSNPSVEDLCDGPEPRYRLDPEKYREWVEKNPPIFNGPTQVKRVDLSEALS